MLNELRKTLALLERPPGLEDPGVVALGIEPIDATLGGGGLARGALHEIAAASEAHVTSACGFAVGLCSLMAAAHTGRTPSPPRGRLRPSSTGYGGEGWGEGVRTSIDRNPSP